MIIVTGGAGFIGSNIVRALNERGRTDILIVDDLGGGKNSRRGVGDFKARRRQMPRAYRRRIYQLR